jgi:hypothetical protein
LLVSPCTLIGAAAWLLAASRVFNRRTGFSRIEPRAVSAEKVPDCDLSPRPGSGGLRGLKGSHRACKYDASPVYTNV